MLSSALHTADTQTVCDRWLNYPSTVMLQGGQHYDPTRSPIVQVQGADGVWRDYS